MKRFFMLAGIAIVLLSQLGCSSDEEQTALENPAVIDEAAALSGAPLLGDVVLENMYEDEVRNLTDKTPVQIVTVLEGTNRVVLDARFRGIRDLGIGLPVYEFELMDEIAEAMGGIAQGMSGSPVGPPGRIMGALAYGDSFTRAPSRFWATPIDAMEAAIDHQTFGEMLAAELAPAAPGVRINAAYTPVKTPLMITGIQPHRLEQLSTHLDGARFDFIELFAAIDNAPAAPPTQTTRLAAGDMIGVATATGDVVNAIGFGTVTQVYDDGTFVGFGHPMNGGGHSALPVYRAVTNGIVSNLAVSYKSVSAYGNPIGTITKDLTPGIVGELGTLPSMIPVKFTYEAGNRPAVVKNHQLAYGQEAFLPFIAAITLDSILQERTSATIDGTVTLNFQETETAYTESFRSASPEPFYDILFNIERIVFAFTDMLSNSAGKATLADVSISISAKPQLMLAEIQKVIVPEAEIIPGEDLTVSVVLLPHWSAVNGERTIQREVTLEVPEDFPAGPASVTVAPEDGFGFFDPSFEFDPSEFDGFREEGEEEPDLLPENLDELIKRMEEVQIDSSAITITLMSLGFPGDDEFPIDDEFFEDGEFPIDGEFPEDGEMPEDGEAPEDGEMPEDDEALEDGEMPGDGEMPPDLPFPEDFPPLDGLPFPPDFELPPPIEVTISIDGFIVIGFKDVSVTIAGEEMGDGTVLEDIADGMPLEENGEPVEPAEPAEPAEEE